MKLPGKKLLLAPRPYTHRCYQGKYMKKDKRFSSLFLATAPSVQTQSPSPNI